VRLSAHRRCSAAYASLSPHDRQVPYGRGRMRFAGKDLRRWLNSRDGGDVRLPRVYRYKPEKIKMAGGVRGQSMAARPARRRR
jgi:hypothetical protein